MFHSDLVFNYGATLRSFRDCIKCFIDLLQKSGCGLEAFA